jgi:hypothetical protein
MRPDDPTFRMRKEQLGELVSLTSPMPTQRQTAEMPAVELTDLLRKDRELDGTPVVTAEHFDVNLRYDGCTRSYTRPESRFAAGTIRIPGSSRFKLLLGCLAAFGGGFALTTPLWW